MKLVILGANGQVGHELQASLSLLGEVIALDRSKADLTKLNDLKQTLTELKPDVIINAAAYTAVDKAEQDQDLAMLINGDAPGVIAEVTKQLNALLIHYSTDYVFDGTKKAPYTEDDIPNPINVYGKTKLAGEKAIQNIGGNYLIFRTSWVYSLHGHNFLKTILRLAQEREELNIVDDQVGAPTWARTISEVTSECIKIAQENKTNHKFSPGIYNLVPKGSTTWCGFTNEIVKLAKENENYKVILDKISPIMTEQYPTPAQRPLNSRLCVDKLQNDFKVSLPSWQTVLVECMESK